MAATRRGHSGDSRADQLAAPRGGECRAPCLPAVVSKARLRRPVERFPRFRVEAGATGTVTEATERLIAMRMDASVPGAEEWNNEVCWTPEDGEALLGPGAGGEEHVAAAFDVDAEVTTAGPGGEESRVPGPGGEAPLGFYDHHRQRYSAKVRIAEAGDFLIGDYNKDGTVGEDGEFRVELVELSPDGCWPLHPRLSAFGDGVGALRRAIGAGLLGALAPVRDSEGFSRRLIALGLVDRSDRPLPRHERPGRRSR